MSNPEFRLLARSDLGALAKLHGHCFSVDPWTVRDFLELLAIRGASGHLAIGAEREIAGFILDLIGPEDAEILTIGVAPGARRHGIARALIANLAKRARQRGARRLLLEVAADNEAAIALYRSIGFILLGERPGYYRLPSGRADALIFGLLLSYDVEPA
ncbi:MAG TPA: ribosomal protein S18-alanine N-acetyltransferase [Stellaceae bacterium]|nr:ribosomal protein S18-alanine N-acetyltransferase [Stellaceae bacterium]